MVQVSTEIETAASVTNKQLIRSFIEKKQSKGAKEAVVDVEKLGMDKCSIATPYGICKEKKLYKKSKGRHKYFIKDVVKEGKKRNSDVKRFTVFNLN